MAPQRTLPDFTAVDVELANPKYGSVCSVALVRVRNGLIVDARQRFCVPPPDLNHFGARQMQLHKITSANLLGALPFAQTYRLMCRFVGDDVLVEFGNDRAMLGQSCDASGILMADHVFVDAAALSRQLLPGLSRHRLPDVARHFGVELNNHHDALADAKACAEIFVALGAPYQPQRPSCRYGGGGPASAYARRAA